MIATRRILLLGTVMCLLGAPVLLFAEDFDSAEFRPVTAEVIAQGGSFTAVASGYNSLFTNPAGLARPNGSFTLLSANVQLYVPPNDENLEALSSIADDPTGTIENISDVIMDNGIGAGARIGAIGIAGRRLGFAAVGEVDFHGRGGTTVLGTTVDLVYTTGLVAGYAIPFHLGDKTLNVGADVKLLRRAEARDLGLVELLEAANGESETIDVPVLTGAAVGFDIGAIFENGPWRTGISLRDVGGTKFRYTMIESIEDPAEVISFESGTETVSDNYAIPMSINIGLGWDPESDHGLLKWLFDPKVHVEWQHVLYKEDFDPSFWSELHAGVELRMLRFLKVRAGINQGYGTVGLGAKLLFADVNLAYYMREMGEHAGEKPNGAFAVEAAIRF